MSVPDYRWAVEPAAPASTGSARVVFVVGGGALARVFVADAGTVAGEWPRHFIGTVDGVEWWAADVPDGDDPSDGAAVDLRSFHALAPEHHWLAAGRGLQVVEWARTHRFCGRCASETERVPGDRAMRCPACGLLAYPRVAPAMITLITRGDPGPDQEILLARGRGFPTAMYSCLAGFVEPGDTLESSVVREVREEVGIEVADVEYFGSQPWPFPHSLMVGFRARYVSGEVTPDPTEIADAGWYRRDALPQIPPPISIARKLIDSWLGEA